MDGDSLLFVPTVDPLLQMFPHLPHFYRVRHVNVINREDDVMPVVVCVKSASRVVRLTEHHSHTRVVDAVLQHRLNEQFKSTLQFCFPLTIVSMVAFGNHSRSSFVFFSMALCNAPLNTMTPFHVEATS